MLGREHELEMGRHFVNSLSRSSACLVLEGEAGIGKTTVWLEMVALARAAGHRVLASRPAAAEAKLSYAGLADLFSGLEPDLLEGLPSPQRAALAIALLHAAPGQEAPEPRALFTAFASVLSALAAAGPLLVAIDDLQWLDHPSQAAVEFALRRLGNRSIGFLATVRRNREAVMPAGLARALHEAGAERVELGPLSVGALHALISTRLGVSFARPILVRIATASRGNPFYALEIARELARRGEPLPGEAFPVPENLFELVSARVRRLPPATQEALLAAAALRHPDLDLLDRSALEPAEEAGLVRISGERLAFEHPLFAAAVYSSATATRRRRLHDQLAAAMTDPEERARHLALAAAGPSEHIAAELEAAAALARSRGAPDGAAELLELAVGLTPADDPDARRSRSIAAAESYFHAGNLARARSLAEELLTASPPGPARGHVLRVLGEVRYHQDSFVDAIRLFEEALPELAEDRRRVDLRVNLTFAHIGHGSLKAAADQARLALEEALIANDGDLYGVALGGSVIADFLLGRPLDRVRLEQAVAQRDPDRSLVMSIRPSLTTANVLSMCDQLDRAAGLLYDLRRRTVERGEESDLPMVCAQLSYVERQRGNLAQALAFAEEGYQIGRTLGSGTAQALMLAERCFVRATLGDVDAARADVGEADRILSQVGYRLALFWLRWAQVYLETSVSNFTRAGELHARTLGAVEARGSFDPQAALTLTDTLEALVAAGELDRAGRLTTMLDEYGHIHGIRSPSAHAARCDALLLAARGNLAAAHEKAEEALVTFEQVPLPIEAGRALLVRGQVEWRAKQKRAARESLERALAIFESSGVGLWAGKARTELSRMGARRTRPTELTASELRVAELAAGGLTIRRIAETAFLSPKTVEAHLSRIYSKLGIRSRAELGAAMAERVR
jgi:DNA-binding CsgD family transcriptional regulator